MEEAGPVVVWVEDTVALALGGSVIGYHRNIVGIGWTIELLAQAQPVAGFDKAGRKGHMVIRAARPSEWERDSYLLALWGRKLELREEAEVQMLVVVPLGQLD